jgi:hypothetical protein
MNTVGIWKQMQEASEESSGDVKLEMMPEDTDWSALL